MKKLLTVFSFVLFLVTLQNISPHALAACNWTNNTSGVTATTCGIDGQSSEYYDYSAGADDATNGYNVTIPNGVTVTVNAGIVSALTHLGVGKFTFTGGGTLAVSSNYIAVTVGPKCYVLDSDADGYSPSPNTCSTTGGVGYVRKNKLTSTAVDCSDANATAHPGQTTPSSGTFTNTATGLSYDWNCDGVQTQTYATATYSCTACTNSGGYASTINTTNGYSGSVPACGAAGTYYTVTNATCQNPAVASCTGAYTTASVTQTCL